MLLFEQVCYTKEFIVMRKVLVSFLVIFGLVCGQFLIESCSGSNLVWSTSNGIVTYNRHTGQFELMWDTSQQNQKQSCDTVWICPEDSSRWLRIGYIKR